MTTKEVINKFPYVMLTIEHLRDEYSNNKIDHKELMDKSSYYLKGLEHANLITQREKRILFSYSTIKK